jgi:hypothetical protein
MQPRDGARIAGHHQRHTSETVRHDIYDNILTTGPARGTGGAWPAPCASNVGTSRVTCLDPVVCRVGAGTRHVRVDFTLLCSRSRLIWRAAAVQQTATGSANWPDLPDSKSRSRSDPQHRRARGGEWSKTPPSATARDSLAAQRQPSRRANDFCDTRNLTRLVDPRRAAPRGR